ncbi:MAG: thioredoxin domain-containing protein [bacterium]|nr:thioredoxin domain-containing protein [bacterium]
MKKYLPAIIISVVILAVIGFVVFALKSTDNKQSDLDKTSSKLISNDDKKLLTVGWSSGPEGAKTVLTEFGDFQCAACKKYEPILADLKKEFENKFKLIFKEFPLTNIHKNAELAALSAEAAGDQGKFWEMHGLLYVNQEKWAESNEAMNEFINFASQLGLDVTKFKNDVESKKFIDKINQDRSLGDRLAVPGTPTFYINGEVVDTTTGSDALRQAIKNAVEK